jgi:hypothetical protein
VPADVCAKYAGNTVKNAVLRRNTDGISLDRDPPPDTMPRVANFLTEGYEMAEKVAKLGVSREKDFMYYVKDGNVWKVQRKQPGVPKGRPEKVSDGGVEMDTNYIYFLDRDGDIARAKRAIGGQKRKKKAGAKKKAAKKKSTKKAAKKAKKSGGKKKAKKKGRR